MTNPDDDAYWRRPVADEHSGVPPATGANAGVHGPPAPSGGHEVEPGSGPAPAQHAGEHPGSPAYQGPPRAVPPPPGWRVPAVPEPHSPRHMPEQDHAALDAAERRARVVTYGFGIAAGVVLLGLLFVVCAQLIG